MTVAVPQFNRFDSARLGPNLGSHHMLSWQIGRKTAEKESLLGSILPVVCVCLVVGNLCVLSLVNWR